MKKLLVALLLAGSAGVNVEAMGCRDYSAESSALAGRCAFIDESLNYFKDSILALGQQLDQQKTKIKQLNETLMERDAEIAALKAENATLRRKVLPEGSLGILCNAVDQCGDLKKSCDGLLAGIKSTEEMLCKMGELKEKICEIKALLGE